MPTMPISHFTWQVLRAVKRSKQPPTGKQLRLIPSRKTKDGTFLDGLVNEGLLQVVSVDELPRDATDREKGNAGSRPELATHSRPKESMRPSMANISGR